MTGYEYGHGHVGDPPEALCAGQPESSSWVKVTDPAGKLHTTFSDNLGREIRVIRNYGVGTE